MVTLAEGLAAKDAPSASRFGSRPNMFEPVGAKLIFVLVVTLAVLEIPCKQTPFDRVKLTPLLRV